MRNVDRATASGVRHLRLLCAGDTDALDIIADAIAFPSSAWRGITRLDLQSMHPSPRALQLLESALPALQELGVYRDLFTTFNSIFLLCPLKFPSLKSFTLQGGDKGANLRIPPFSAALERLCIAEVTGPLDICVESIPSLKSIEVRSIPELHVLNIARLTGLLSLTLHDLPELRHLQGSSFGFDELEALFYLKHLEKLSSLTSLERLAITGKRQTCCVPRSIAALTQLTHLEIDLRRTAGARFGPDAESAPLGLSGEPGGLYPPSPLVGCTALRELVIRDRGARLAVPQDALESLAALEVLDLGGVLRPLLPRCVRDMPSLRRLVVPQGAVNPKVLKYLSQRAGMRGARGRGGRGSGESLPNVEVVVVEAHPGTRIPNSTFGIWRKRLANFLRRLIALR